MGIAPQKNERQIPTQVKNQDLVQRRRHQIVDAAVELFIQNGFHKTTTRQIAKAAGVSIGSLYEYVASKEDVLYLVCDAIHAEMQRGMAEAMQRVADQGNPLAEVVRAYLLVCDRMNDHILLIYQETQSLPGKWQRVVLENEVRITGLFTRALAHLMAAGEIEPARAAFSISHCRFKARERSTARIIGITPWRDVWFWDMPLAWQSATVFFGVLDLVAAIGLWLAVSWGTVMWLFRCFCQIVMHTAFSDLYGRRPYEISFYLLTIGIYALLVWLMEKELSTNNETNRSPERTSFSSGIKG